MTLVPTHPSYTHTKEVLLKHFGEPVENDENYTPPDLVWQAGGGTIYLWFYGVDYRNKELGAVAVAVSCDAEGPSDVSRMVIGDDTTEKEIVEFVTRALIERVQ